MTAASGERAVKNARKVQTYPVGYCLMYVRAEAWQIPALFGSAIEAWNGARKKHRNRQVPIGAPVYYAGGQFGHIVVYTQAGRMRSTDCPTPTLVSETDLDWPVRAWGDTYLGWSEDLNGVDLPLEEGDEMNEADWERLESIVAKQVDRVWADKMTVTQPGTDEDTQKRREQVLRETWQKVTRST